MSSLLRIGMAQLDTAWEDPVANMLRGEALMQHEKELDLLVLPEMWATGFTMHTEKSETGHPGPALTWMLNKAATSGLHIAGSLAVNDGDHFFNRFFDVSPAGEIHQYDKRHLFSYGKEDHHYSAGHLPLTYILGDWKIRAIICYDLRFPVWCRNTDDYDVLLVVANWPEARIHHWDALLRARAIENQCYVVGVNRTGTDGNHLVYNGHSAAYDMNGQPLITMGVMEGIGRITLDKESLVKFRQHYRFLQDRDPFSL